jgi:hypothetical protein
MKISVRNLRRLIREAMRGSHPEESYDKGILQDPAYRKKSVYVPDDVKEKIEVWLKQMKMSDE